MRRYQAWYVAMNQRTSEVKMWTTLPNSLSIKEPFGAGCANTCCQRCITKLSVQVAVIKCKLSGHKSYPSMRRYLAILFSPSHTKVIEQSKTVYPSIYPSPTHHLSFLLEEKEISVASLLLIAISSCYYYFYSLSVLRFLLIAVEYFSVFDGLNLFVACICAFLLIW